MKRRRTAANPFMLHSRIALNLMSWHQPPQQQPPVATNGAKSSSLIAPGGSAASGGGNVQPAVGRWRRRHFFSSMLGQMEQQNGGGEGGASGEEKQPEHPVIRWIKLIGPHVILYLSTMLYGLFGAMVFQRLERPFEVHHLQEHSEAVGLAQQHFLRLKWAQQMNGTDAPEEAELELAVDNLIRLHMQAFEQGIRADELALAIEDFNAKQAMGFSGSAEDEESGGNRSPKWHFHSSLFFTATLLTSIGYGNLVPISPLGRLFCIGYAFLGIPLTLITIADIAKFLSERILNLSDWLEQNVFRRKRHGDERPIIQMDLKRDDDIILRQPGAYTKLPSLRTIDLSDNKLSGGLDKLAESCPRLYHINLCANKITDIETLAPLKNLEELAALDLFDCAVTESPDYRPSVFRLIPHLKYLDGFDVNDVEADLSEEEDDVAEDVGDEDLGSDDEEAFDSGEDELAYLNSSKAIQDEDDSADYAGSEGIPATNGEKKNGGSSTVSSTAATAGSDAGNNRKRKLEEAAGADEKAEGEPEAKV